MLAESFRFIGEVIVGWFGLYLAFVSGRQSPGWQFVGCFLFLVAVAGMICHLNEDPPMSDEWLIGKDKDGMVSMTRRPVKH